MDEREELEPLEIPELSGTKIYKYIRLWTSYLRTKEIRLFVGDPITDFEKILQEAGEIWGQWMEYAYGAKFRAQEVVDRAPYLKQAVYTDVNDAIKYSFLRVMEHLKFSEETMYNVQAIFRKMNAALKLFENGFWKRIFLRTFMFHLTGNADIPTLKLVQYAYEDLQLLKTRPGNHDFDRLIVDIHKHGLEKGPVINSGWELLELATEVDKAQGFSFMEGISNDEYEKELKRRINLGYSTNQEDPSISTDQSQKVFKEGTGLHEIIQIMASGKKIETDTVDGDKSQHLILKQPKRADIPLCITRKQHIYIQQYKPGDSTSEFAIIILPIQFVEFWICDHQGLPQQPFRNLAPVCPFAKFHNAHLRLSNFVPMQKSLTEKATDVPQINHAPYAFCAEDIGGLYPELESMQAVDTTCMGSQTVLCASSKFWTTVDEDEEGILGWDKVETFVQGQIISKSWSFNNHPRYFYKTPYDVNDKLLHYVPADYPLMNKGDAKEDNLLTTGPRYYGKGKIGTVHGELYGGAKPNMGAIALFMPYIESITKSENATRLKGWCLLETEFNLTLYPRPPNGPSFNNHDTYKANRFPLYTHDITSKVMQFPTWLQS